MEKINYLRLIWIVRGDFKVLGLLLLYNTVDAPDILVLSVCGTAENLTSITTKRTASQKTINSRHTHSVNHEALVVTDKILLPPFHIKLELVKQCVKALDLLSDSWQHVCYTCPRMF